MYANSGLALQLEAPPSLKAASSRKLRTNDDRQTGAMAASWNPSCEVVFFWAAALSCNALEAGWLLRAGRRPRMMAPRAQQQEEVTAVVRRLEGMDLLNATSSGPW